MVSRHRKSVPSEEEGVTVLHRRPSCIMNSTASHIADATAAKNLSYYWLALAHTWRSIGFECCLPLTTSSVGDEV